MNFKESLLWNFATQPCPLSRVVQMQMTLHLDIIRCSPSSLCCLQPLCKEWFRAESVFEHFTVPFSIQSSFLIFDVESNMSSARSTVERD